MESKENRSRRESPTTLITDGEKSMTPKKLYTTALKNFKFYLHFLSPLLFLLSRYWKIYQLQSNEKKNKLFLQNLKAIVADRGNFLLIAVPSDNQCENEEK